MRMLHDNLCIIGLMVTHTWMIEFVPIHSGENWIYSPTVCDSDPPLVSEEQMWQTFACHSK